MSIYRPDGTSVSPRTPWWKSGDLIARGIAIVSLLASGAQCYSMDQSNLIQRQVLLQQKAETESELTPHLVSMGIDPHPDFSEVIIKVRVTNAGLGATSIVRGVIDELSPSGLAVALAKISQRKGVFGSEATAPAVGISFASSGATTADLERTRVEGRDSNDITIVLRLDAVVQNRAEFLDLLRSRGALALLELVDVQGHVATLNLWNCGGAVFLQMKEPHPSPPDRGGFMLCSGDAFRTDLPDQIRN